MEREKIINACAEIFSAFEEANTLDEELSLISFLTWITQEKFDFISGILNKFDLKLEGEHVEDVLTSGVWTPLAQTAFGFWLSLVTLYFKKKSRLSGESSKKLHLFPLFQEERPD